MTRAGQPRSATRGIIINVASIYGLTGTPAATPAAAYTSAKHAVMGLTKTVCSPQRQAVAHYCARLRALKAICLRT